MKGKNILHLNAATLMEAVQEYLDKRMGPYSPKVTAIKDAGTTYTDEFKVSVEEREPDAPNGERAL